MPRLYFLSSATCTWAVRGMRTTNLLRSNSGYAQQEQSDRGDVEGAAEESCCGEQGILPLLSGGKMREPVPARGHQRPSSPRRETKVVDDRGIVPGAAPPAAGSRPIVSAAPGDATKTTPPPPPPTAASSSTLAPSSAVPPPPTANSAAPPEPEAEAKPPPSSVICGGEGSTDAARPPATDVPTSVAPTDQSETSSAPPTTGAAETPKKTTSTSTTTKDSRPSIDHLPWEDGSLTAYWDCSTMGWMCNNQPATQRQQPYVPTDAERTKEYGEDLWITGAASDSMRDRGPGKKCYLIRGVEPNPDFRVLAMLTNSCPGYSNPVCQRPKVHIDVAAPGWDNQKFSKSQHCGEPGKIGQKESGAINNWIMNPDDPGWQTGNPPGQLTWTGWSRPKEERTTFFTDRCKELKNGYAQGCLNFVKWGWKQGDPQAKFANIPCPQAWVQKTGCPDR